MSPVDSKSCNAAKNVTPVCQKPLKLTRSVEERIGAYVYSLIDPRNEMPFYIGKGNCNRAFAHANCAQKSLTESNTIARIREIETSGNHVAHIIIRHGLDDISALVVESAIIDFCIANRIVLTNAVLGHGATSFGLMTVDEITRKYDSEPLNSIGIDCVLININKSYQRGKGALSYYKAVKESWIISEAHRARLKYALAEFHGIVVEVFEILDWYHVQTTGRNGKPSTKWGFNGKVARDNVRALYLNKSLSKVKGQSNPIRYNIKPSEPVAKNVKY